MFVVYLIYTFQSQMDQTINVHKIRDLIDRGYSYLPNSKKLQRSVLVIGDTGVGKSTILSFLTGRKLIVKNQGLNFVIDAAEQGGDGLKIGHNKYSETSIPTKISIGDLDFYDCSGFKDNRGDEFQISNSFFLQRLVNVYKENKILLIIDENYISQARIDKLPKLIRNLSDAFGSLETIQDGLVLLVNRAKLNFQLKDYYSQLSKLSLLKNQKGFFFTDKERLFIQYLINKERILLFKQADEKLLNKSLEQKDVPLILSKIKSLSSIKVSTIKNILSESTKLAIREYIDILMKQSEQKVWSLLSNIKVALDTSVKLSAPENKINQLKYSNKLLGQIISQLKALQNEDTIVDLLLHLLPTLFLGELQKDFSSIIFFKEIYPQAYSSYFALLKQRIITELTMYKGGSEYELAVLENKEKQHQELKNNFQQLKLSYQKLQEIKKIEEQQRQKVYTAALESQKKYQERQNVMKKQLELKTSEVERLSNLCKGLQLEVENKKSEFGQLTQMVDGVKNESKKIGEEYKQAVREFEILKKEFGEKSKDLNALEEQNESLKEALERLSLNDKSENASVLSMASKSSKYPEVHCPHFKNGGQCKHCIRKWKESQQFN